MPADDDAWWDVTNFGEMYSLGGDIYTRADCYVAVCDFAVVRTPPLVPRCTSTALMSVRTISRLSGRQRQGRTPTRRRGSTLEDIDVFEIPADGWRSVGNIAIESGSCWIGDPLWDKPAASTAKAGLLGRDGQPTDGTGFGVLVETGVGEAHISYEVSIRTDPESGRTIGVLIDFGVDGRHMVALPLRRGRRR
jgi:hypothetical protein